MTLKHSLDCYRSVHLYAPREASEDTRKLWRVFALQDLNRLDTLGIQGSGGCYHSVWSSAEEGHAAAEELRVQVFGVRRFFRLSTQWLETVSL